jgi:hypothetical protein
MCTHHEQRVPAALVLMLVALLVGVSACGGSQRGRPDVSHPRERRSPQPEATPSGPAHAGVAWTYDALMHRLNGRRVRVGGRTVRIDPATVACGGVGRPARRVHGAPAWSRFRCVQPTFPPGEVAGPDVIFIVKPTGPRTLAVTHARLTSY